jgi:chromosome segregation ATPase
MARTSNITFGQVAAIADAMKAAGNRPTARAVRERIGSGSMGTIHKLLQQWSGKGIASDEDEDEGRELPQSIQSALMDFIGTEIATACEPISEELQAAKDATNELAEENERLEKTIDQLEKQSYNAEMKQAEAMARDRESRNELIEARATIEKLQMAVAQLTVDLDRSQRQTQMMASYAPELEELKRDHSALNGKFFLISSENGVMAAKLEAAEEKIVDLKERLTIAEKIKGEQEAELRVAISAANKATAELGSLARELSDLKATPKVAQAAKTSAKKAAPKKPVNQELAV